MADDKGFVLGDGEADGDSAEAMLPGINFSTFIMSLNASALMSLGVIDDPTTGKRARNLVVAKHTIDTLAMLQEKTQGNLAEDENSMLLNILSDLRIMYVREKS